MTLSARFMAKVEVGPVSEIRPDLGACWLWTGSTSKGYGRLTAGGRGWQAHRYAYTIEVAPVPAMLDLDHLCRVRRCVRSTHVEPVTRSVNLSRGELGSVAPARLAPACKNGHAYTPETTYVTNYVTKRGTRQCRECNRQAVARSRAAKAAA